MFAEWLLFIALLGAGAFMAAGRLPARQRWTAWAVLATLAILSAFFWRTQLRSKELSRAQLSVPKIEERNVWAGSESCRACHPRQYASWHRSYHRTMTQVASPESVRGDFNNVVLSLDGEEYRLYRRGDEFWVDMPDPAPRLQKDARARVEHASRVQRRISLVTGSHHMQAFWTDNKHGNQQFSLPFTYLFENERWVPRRTVFIRNPADTNWAQVWNVGCIGCHSTAGQPGMEDAQNAVFNSRVAELGIACEACHGPAGEHVRLNANPLHRYRAHFRRSGGDHIVNPARLPSKKSSEVCGQCHSVHAPADEEEWLKTGFGYKPGDDLDTRMRVLTNPRSKELRQSCFWNDGMIRVSGREYNGLIKSPCYLRGELSCLSCHSMHESPPAHQLAEGMESNAACLQCHGSIEKKLEEHTHHAAGSSGSLCYNCHMPYTTYGLLKALRSHQISSPSVAANLQTGRPNACNICHLDKTLDWTAQKLTAWYRQPEEKLKPEEKSVAASILWALRGDAGVRALAGWYFGWAPARLASGEDWLPPFLAVLMQDHYPAVRYVAGRSLKRLPAFEHFTFDYLAAEQIESSAQNVFALWQKSPKTSPKPELLLGANGELDRATVKTLLSTRNNRVVELNE